MANTSRIFGFRPERHLQAQMWSGATMLHFHHASDATDIYIGDQVQMDTTNRSSSGTDIYVPSVPAVQAPTAATTTAVQRGVAVGFLPVPEFSQSATASLGTKYSVASTARYVWVVVDPFVIYEVESVGNPGIACVNKCVDLNYVAGNTTTGISGSSTNATATTNATKPWRVVQAVQRLNNDPTLTASHWEVMLMTSDLMSCGTPNNQGA